MRQIRWVGALGVLLLLPMHGCQCGQLDFAAPRLADVDVSGTWRATQEEYGFFYSLDLYLERDADQWVGAGAFRAEREPVGSGYFPAASDAECKPLATAGANEITFLFDDSDVLLVQGAVTYDLASDTLNGDWQLIAPVGAAGPVTFHRIAWFAARQVTADYRLAPLGCSPRALPQCADGIDNDGDDLIDDSDGDCCPSFPCLLFGNDEATHGPCVDGVDNDGDGSVDGEDAECSELKRGHELFASNTCRDHVDNDGDGDIDRWDSNCGGGALDHEAPPEPPPLTMCEDGVDNDGDALVDAADEDCARGDEEHPDVPECSDGADNDFDGLTDLDDPSCVGRPLWGQEAPFYLCDDGLDNDGDGIADLDDDDCEVYWLYGESGGFGYGNECTDGVDNDADGELDADDVECLWVPDGEERPTSRRAERPPRPCMDGVDNDGDAVIDEVDPGCRVLPGFDFGLDLGLTFVLDVRTWTMEPPDQWFESTPPCLDGLDNDGDGLIDFADPACAGPFSRSERFSCDDGLDDDGDGRIDLDDPACRGDPREVERRSACDDGDDDDADGRADADDPDCDGPWDTMEYSACSNGDDDDGDRLYDLADPGCSSAADDDEGFTARPREAPR